MFNKRKCRALAILTTLAFLLTFLPVGAGISFGSTGYTATAKPAVDDDQLQELGTVLVEVAAGSLKGGHAVNFRLPDDFEFGTVIDATYGPLAVKNRNGGLGTKIEVPDRYEGEDNGLSVDELENIVLLDTNEIQVKLKDNFNDKGYKVHFKLVLQSIWIDSGFSGDIELIAETTTGTSAFPQGKVVVGYVPGGLVQLSVPTIKTFSDSTLVKIRIKETVAGSLEKSTQSMKVKLPAGFKWVVLTTTDDPDNKYPAPMGSAKDVGSGKYLWGKAVGDDGGYGTADGLSFNSGKINDNEDEITIDVKHVTDNAAYFEVLAKIEVDDETEAKVGDVVVKISGDSDFNTNEGTIAKYGELKASISAKSTPELIAGMTEQEIGDILIKEDAAESLVKGRTIILTLPSFAKWGKMDTQEKDSGAEIQLKTFPGSDGRAAKWEIMNQSSGNDAAELVLEDQEVVLEPGAEGDLTIEVSGTAGLSGTIVVGKVKQSISAKAETKPEVKIGLADQATGDILITENIKGAIKDDKDMIIDLPDGVKFATVPKVEVTNGDLDIDINGVKRGKDGNESDNLLYIPIDGESTTPSTIKISEIKYIVDRTVPEGDIVAKIKGTAVAEVNDLTEIKDYYDDNTLEKDKKVYIDDKPAFNLDDGMIWPNSTSAAKVSNAVCVTPAPGEVKPGTAVFKIGDTKYKIGDKEETMDVAPYVKNNRTYLPVRYVAYALGVTPGNILWDNSNGTVTLIKGDRVIQVQIKSKVMLINGAKVVMDVAPELKDGRTMLPFRWIAQALGASVEWDEATQTVTMKI